MTRLIDGLLWLFIGVATAGLVRLTLPLNTVFALGLLAGVAIGGLYTAHNRLSRPTLATLVVTLSTGLIVAAVSVAVLSAWWLPSIWTATIGYAIGIVATWLLVSGLSLDELGGFAAIAGLVVAVAGGAAGILYAPDLRLFIAVLFAGLAAGFVVPFSSLLFALLRANSRGARRSTDEGLTPATRFGIEATAIAALAIVVPFGSRGVALFGYGELGAFPFGLAVGTLLGVGPVAVAGGRSERLDRLRTRFVERVYRLLDRLTEWLDRRRREGTEQGLDESAMGDGGGETAAAGDDPASLAVASNFVEGVATRLTDHELVIEAAEEIESLVEANSGLQDRVNRLWTRFSGTVARTARNSGLALQLSAAEEARSQGDTERAQSLTDAALEFAAPTIGSVAAAVVRGRGDDRSVLDSLAPLFARIDHLLGERQLPTDDDDPEQFQLIQTLLERLIEEEAGEGFDTALSRIRAAAADGWYSVQAGDAALEAGEYRRALVAYLAGIEAYRRAYDIAEESKTAATNERRSPDNSSGPGDTDAGSGGVTASASTYASEASRIATAIEAILHDTAAVVVAATDDLYGTQPPPTVDTEARRTIVRTLRTLRQTRTRVDATVPPIELADKRYQHAEIARSIARLRRHLRTADDAAASGNTEAAVDQYERVADRLDVLSNRAGNNGLAELARSLKKTAAGIGAVAREPTPEAVADRPELSVPSTDDHRTPEVAPVGRRLRRTFCPPAFVDLWEFVGEVGDHSLLDIAGEPYPDLVGSVGVALSGLDPLYSEPDVDSLQEWVSELTLDALSAAVEDVAAAHSELVDGEPAPPPAFREPPEVLQDSDVTTLPIADVGAYSETWLERATALVEAADRIERQQSAVDGFAALEPRIRKALQSDGSLDSSQVTAELLEVAAHHLSGVEYDPEAELLTKTGSISRRASAETSAPVDTEPPAPSDNQS
ncbi:MAG: UbiA family prenyltransferase [Euryarchaeota archaeon]|nr:UbiA family prenyltransferase [Euryarchaeota archaeon]